MAEELLLEAPAPGATRPKLMTRQGLYRVVWRWHFYAGLIVSPVLIVVALTGGLYIFKDSLERLVYPGLMVVEPGDRPVTYEAQVEAARREFPAGYKVQGLAVRADPTRPTVVSCLAPDRPLRETFVDPGTGKVLGSLEKDGIFGVILDIHRRLLVGTVGRVVVELTACWTIVLLVTGLYLWWPRGRFRAMGTLLPRLRAKPYTILRDLHSLAGFYLLPIALTIAATGLLYTFAWGAGYRYAAQKTGAFAFFRVPPKATSAPSARPLPLDELVAIGRRRYPDASLTINLASKPGRARVLLALGEDGPRVRGGLALDPSTGAILSELTPGRAPAMARWSNWNYPLHVGSVLGTPTRILWLVACLALVALPITGVWMWWERRPTGRTGFPRRPAAEVPGWMIGVILALSALLPTVGASLVLILAGEWALGRLSSRRAAATPGVA